MSRQSDVGVCRGIAHLADVGDAMRALLVQRAVVLAGWTEGSPERAEPTSAVDVIEAYEAKR
jgi:hypothetical protein